MRLVDGRQYFGVVLSAAKAVCEQTVVVFFLIHVQGFVAFV